MIDLGHSGWFRLLRGNYAGIRQVVMQTAVVRPKDEQGVDQGNESADHRDVVEDARQKVTLQVHGPKVGRVHRARGHNARLADEFSDRLATRGKQVALDNQENNLADNKATAQINRVQSQLVHGGKIESHQEDQTEYRWNIHDSQYDAVQEGARESQAAACIARVDGRTQTRIWRIHGRRRGERIVRHALLLSIGPGTTYTIERICLAIASSESIRSASPTLNPVRKMSARKRKEL